MENIFTTYPEVPWKPGWQFSSGPDNHLPFLTAGINGSLTATNGDWHLQMTQPELICTTRLFYNGFSIGGRRRPEKNRIDAILTGPGLLCGTVAGLPDPQLISGTAITKEPGCEWLRSGDLTVLFRQRENRFALVYGPCTFQQALSKAEDALDQNFEELMQAEAEKRKNVSRLFSINSRHNPPVALAFETLTARLRDRNGAIRGIWSVADGFEKETFSLNELYPLVRAWCLINPAIALDLAQTALSLQQSNGGFPTWINADGIASTVAPWPLIAQSFELALRSAPEPAVLKKHLPALRKYVQWALRRFDPRRDRIPFWQSEQEVFVPGSYERDKATPELTVFLIAELDSVLRLCEASEHSESAMTSLVEEREHLIRTLDTTFWNPGKKAFSNVWENGHYRHEVTFGSFVPLFWSGLDSEKKSALIESFEAARGLPGQRSVSWEQDETDDTTARPAIHQFMAFEIVRSSGNRNLLMQFVHRTREKFAVWFEHESLTAVRSQSAETPAYALGPVTAALALSVQAEFEREAAQIHTVAQLLLRWAERLKIRRTDLSILLVFALLSLLAHLIYAIPHSWNAEERTGEALLNYREGRHAEALRICRRYPEYAISRLIQANMLMLAEQPDKAEELYRQTLLQEPESPSALFGLALALQMNGKFDEAEKRYVDFIDIYELRYPVASQLADEFRMLSQEEFKKPPRWRRIFELPMMNDLGL